MSGAIQNVLAHLLCLELTRDPDRLRQGAGLVRHPLFEQCLLQMDVGFEQAGDRGSALGIDYARRIGSEVGLHGHEAPFANGEIHWRLAIGDADLPNQKLDLAGRTLASLRPC
nr:hypothetical protein [Methylobacterium durans]